MRLSTVLLIVITGLGSGLISDSARVWAAEDSSLGQSATNDLPAATNSLSATPPGPAELTAHSQPAGPAPIDLVAGSEETGAGGANGGAAAAAGAVAVAERIGTLVPAVEALAHRMGAVEQVLALQNQQLLSANESSTRTVLAITGLFSAAGLIGILLGALILARSLNRVSEVVMAAAPALRGLPRAGALEAGPSGDLERLIGPTAVEQVTAKFLGAIEQLERRIMELEQSTQKSFKEIGAGPSGSGAVPSAARPPTAIPLEFSIAALQQKQYPEGPNGTGLGASSKSSEQVVVLLGKAQALLNLDRWEEALGALDEAITLEPANSEAHVKRGIVLEKLQRLEAAIESYDRAIASDASMTLAYLYKGAVCNRLQRFREALECYENALKSEQRLAVPS
jgi:hypothetical protein